MCFANKGLGLPEGTHLCPFQSGEERFGKTPNAGRMAELERLQEFLQAAVAAVDETVAARSAPVERLRKLLSATDKKATLLQMAGVPR